MANRPFDPFAEDEPALTSAYIELRRASDKHAHEADERTADESWGFAPPDRAERFVLHVLASGSKGNAAILRWKDEAVLIDCGITKKAFFERCAEVGFDPRQLKAVLVTHEHTDHTGGLGVVMRGLAKEGVHPAIVTSDAIHRASARIREIEHLTEVSHISTSDDVAVGGIRVLSFPTFHDSVESMGFRFEAGDERHATDCVGFVTDTGKLDDVALSYLSDVRLLAIESNHDPHLLDIGPYPPSLKRRVGGESGHLSNEQSAAAIERLLTNDLECILGMHLSEHNNLPRLAETAAHSVLVRHDHAARYWAASQHRPITVF